MTSTTPKTAEQRATHKRGGFTLIELLVVIAILTLLASLSVVAVFKMQESATDNASDALVSKLHKDGLAREYAGVVGQCLKDRKKPGVGVPQALITYCDNDEDRALAIWTAAHIKRNFPERFAEALAPTDLVPPGVPGVPALPAMKTFTSAIPAGINGTREDESAVLLYLILANSSHTGAEFASAAGTTGATGIIQIGGRDFTVYKDPWNNSVPYFRWASGGVNGELNGSDYVNTKTFPDPLDPKGLVASWSSTDSNKQNQINDIRLRLEFRGTNRVPTVVALGKNGQFDSWSPTGDDRIGYKLDRLGKKGK